MSGLIALENDRLALRVSSQGGAVVDGHTRDGRPFLRTGHSAGKAFYVPACFPLVPIANRVEGNGFDFGGKHHAFKPNTDEPFYIHGDGWLSEWAIEDAGKTGLRLSFEQAQPARSPYVYKAIQTIRLNGATLSLHLSVENRGGDAMPFGIGFHPYFPRTARTRITAPAHVWWTEGANHLPVAQEAIPESADFSQSRMLPQRWLNNCFEGWAGHARIVWPESGLAAEVNADPIFSRYMLYAPDSDRSFFCLEPMSHAPNALAMTGPAALHVLAPGDVLSGGFSVTVSNLEGLQ